MTYIEVTNGKFWDKPKQFISFYTANEDLFRFARGSTITTPLGHGELAYIHGPSVFDSLDWKRDVEGKPGAPEFYGALNEAYKQFNVEWVQFVYWPEKDK